MYVELPNKLYLHKYETLNHAVSINIRTNRWYKINA